LFLFCFYILSQKVEAQSFKKNRIGYIANLGVSTYVGDLATNFQSFTFKPTVGLGISYRLNPIFSFRAELDFFKLAGGNFSKNNSLSFVSNNIEFSSTIIYNLLPERKTFKYRNDFSPFLFAGLGITTYKTVVTQDGKNPDFRLINETSNINATPVIPFGAGVKIKTSAFTDVIIEVGYRKTFTRSLDNVRPQFMVDASSTMPSNGDIAQQEAKIKNSSTDGYFMTSVKIIFSPNQLFKKKIRSATPQGKSMSKKNKTTSKQIARNKKIAYEKVNRIASNH
jgi:hypothetical protein